MDPPCPVCKGTGHEEITTCPRTLIDGQIIELLRMADMAKEHHLWPAAGGMGDQTLRCREAFETLWSEIARTENHLSKNREE